MTKIFRTVLILSFILISVISSSASNEQVNTRSFDSKKIDEMRSDQAYEYIFYVPKEPSWWDKFKNWLKQLLLSFLEATGGSMFKIALYGILIAAFAYIALTLAGIKVTSFFSRKEVEMPLEFSIVNEDVQNLDFNAAIKESIDLSEYRKAIRLTYLWSLQKLSKADRIHWREGKTNQDYKRELPESPLKVTFGDLSSQFEKAWYGKFSVDRDDYLSSKALLDQISAEL